MFLDLCSCQLSHISQIRSSQLDLCLECEKSPLSIISHVSSVSCQQCQQCPQVLTLTRGGVSSPLIGQSAEASVISLVQSWLVRYLSSKGWRSWTNLNCFIFCRIPHNIFNGINNVETNARGGQCVQTNNNVIRESVQFWKTRNNIRLNENRLGNMISSGSANERSVIRVIYQSEDSNSCTNSN